MHTLGSNTTLGILSQLQALERELQQPKTRGDAERLAALLHADFREFGRSGRAYTRAQMLVLLLAETTPIQVHAQDFHLLQLADTVFLLSYRSAHVMASGLLERHTHRSSVWRLEPSGWQLVFHQGTPTEAFVKSLLGPS